MVTNKADIALSEFEEADFEEADFEDAEFEEAPLIGNTKAGTRPTFLGRTHQFIKGLIIPINPPPPKASIEDADYIPEMTAGWFSLLTFGWMNNLMTLGYARPLEASDLWKLQDHRSAGVIAKIILCSFDARRRKADEYNARLSSGEIKPPWSLRVMSRLRGDGEERLKRWREKDGKAQPSLTWAMNDAIKWWFWSGGILKVIADTAQVTTPLVQKFLINFATDSYVAHRDGIQPPGTGKGIGLVIVLVILQLVSSLSENHSVYRTTSTGVLLRGGLITAIYSRSLHLTTRARVTLSNGRLVNHISTDVSRIDFCCEDFHVIWTAPILIAICLALLISNLGPSALAAIFVLVILAPMQGMFVKTLTSIRRKTMVWTDKRVKLLQELLGGMKQIKFFAWEIPFLDQIGGYREREMSHVWSMLLIRGANMAVAMSVPTIISIATFVLYAGTGHQLTPSVVFSSLTWFQQLRTAILFLPLSFSSIVDARNAIGRLQECFTAELISETFEQDPKLKYALEVENANFVWDSPPPDESKEQNGMKEDRRRTSKPEPTSEPKEVKEETLFDLKQIDFNVPRGQLLAIVGAVGSGKTSLLQGLVGDMRKTEGFVRFGGSLAYCSQIAWMQNATIRENICFGRPFEAARYWKVVHDACLEADLDVLPNGDMTEIGERGISLSGGQKQRVNICRAIYSQSDILIFDDPLSALDAHVGESVFNNVLLDSSSGATRILITHALHFLPKVDYIYYMIDGRIAERGTFKEMMANYGEFSRTFDEFVTKDQKSSQEEKAVDFEDSDVDDNSKKRRAAGRGAALMKAEERNIGEVKLHMYKRYFQSGSGVVLLPAMFVTILLMQASFVLSTYWLVWWQDRQWPRSQGFYMGIYAILGVAQAFASFLNGASIAFVIYSVSRRLHEPLGRIMNRFSKDIDTIDNMLAGQLHSLDRAAYHLDSIILPRFLIAVGITFVFYAMTAAFYRASARETKRLDAILQSSLYSHFSESLSGIATIRAYGEEARFLRENRDRVDIENRAYWLTVANRRWLGLRVDFLGILLVLFVAILTVGTRFTVAPAQTGLALTFVLSIQQAFRWTVMQLTNVEDNINSVEHIVYYARDLEQEPPHEIRERKPPALWPNRGELEIKDTFFKYRPELPLVLKGLSMTVKGGEKVGIVGRTGAGKSSIVVALFRLVELESGSISIDGVDISKIGLDDVRNAISIIPQDATLYSGTLRSNLDPFGLHDDALLWDALRRSYLAEDKRMSPASNEEAGFGDDEDQWGTESTMPTAPRFTLDSPIEVEGSNLSIGQRSLVSLARALLKDSKILILDEATASVDYETDRKIQDTITTEFHDRTILCIAHRLRTIISYDRICVMDNGNAVEFDTPEVLHGKNGIFRAMCDRSNITLDDIRCARMSALVQRQACGFVTY
ncbi:ABC transporter [Russula aff. rugulosa BPL654]|nr:ABC transporter [Russula aff. rugulosa BPL654]